MVAGHFFFFVSWLQFSFRPFGLAPLDLLSLEELEGSVLIIQFVPPTACCGLNRRQLSLSPLTNSERLECSVGPASESEIDDIVITLQTWCPDDRYLLPKSVIWDLVFEITFKFLIMVLFFPYL